VSHIYLGGEIKKNINYHLQGKYDSQEMNITIVLAKYLDKEEHKLPPPR
jgi:hypothetical protein